LVYLRGLPIATIKIGYRGERTRYEDHWKRGGGRWRGADDKSKSGGHGTTCFFSAACHSLRRRALARLNPVAGNLFHHAIEMYLKGALSETNSIRELKKFRHKLPSLWTAFKDQTNDIALNQFDATIEDLDRYEEIRYPDAILASGMASTIEIVRSNLPARYEGPKVSEYRICFDELVNAIFSVARRNPAAYLRGDPDLAREFLIKENRASPLTNHLKHRG
jgi:hypothetical protein